MGTKSNPGTFDCYAKAEADEPLFVLLARDPLAPLLVRFWAMLRIEQAEKLPFMSPEADREARKIIEAQGVADAMRQWRRNR